jgi:hypothetical protein
MFKFSSVEFLSLPSVVEIKEEAFANSLITQLNVPNCN